MALSIFKEKGYEMFEGSMPRKAEIEKQMAEELDLQDFKLSTDLPSDEAPLDGYPRRSRERHQRKQRCVLGCTLRIIVNE